MPISPKFPDINPSLILDFENAGILDPRITFTRASVGTYVGSDKLVKIAPAGFARFDHDSVTGNKLGLLIESIKAQQLQIESQQAQIDELMALLK